MHPHLCWRVCCRSLELLRRACPATVTAAAPCRSPSVPLQICRCRRRETPRTSSSLRHLLLQQVMNSSRRRLPHRNGLEVFDSVFVHAICNTVQHDNIYCCVQNIIRNAPLSSAVMANNAALRP